MISHVKNVKKRFSNVKKKKLKNPAAGTVTPADPAATPAAPGEQQEQPKKENPVQPTPASNPEVSNSNNQAGSEDTLNADDQTSTESSSGTVNTPNTPGQSAMLDSIPDNQGTYVGDINNINQQTPWTTTIGGTQSGDAYIGGARNLPNEDNLLPGDAQPQLPAPKEQLGLPAPEEPLALPTPGDTENNQVEEPAEIIPAVKEDPLRGVVPNHEYNLSPREKRRRRDHALGKERRPDKIERQQRNNAKSAAKSQRVQGIAKKRSEAEEVIKEHYNTSAQMSMLNSII